jgi:peptide chain release factor 3
LSISETDHAEIRRRRTFAVISHPDAGKTTLTEKLLLYGGAIQLAGSVTARQNQRKATSDWMELEKQRGISISSTALQFEYGGCMLNLLDTPGHQDFSEDTYRTLMAADSAVMLLDNAKGVEPQTKKLFHVCRRRSIPIFTFINKMDRPGLEPLALMEELEEVLGIRSVAMNWPIGDGSAFRGVFDRMTRQVLLFERTQHGAYRAPVQVSSLADPSLEKLIGPQAAETLRQDIELQDEAGEELDMDRVLRGELTPLFFGSAVTNFGVEPFLNTFLSMAPFPTHRNAEEGEVSPFEPDFRGFIFKIQANMDPQHRDRIGFMRVVSGKFERDMVVTNSRTGKPVRLSRPMKLFGNERLLMEEAYPGDIVGLTNPGAFSLGDTLYTGPAVSFHEIPRFPPERFAILRNTRTDKYKQFQKGIDQLTEEGVVQTFYEPEAARREPILGGVGRLQLEVVQYRLQSEYGVETTMEELPHNAARWVAPGPDGVLPEKWLASMRSVVDCDGARVVLFEGEWSIRYVKELHPSIEFLESPPAPAAA